MQCPRCGCVGLDSERICDCGYNFSTGSGGTPRLSDAARTPAFWLRIASWAVALAFLGGFLGLFGGAWITCKVFYPGTHEADVCGYTGMATGILGAFGGAVAGIALGVRKSLRPGINMNK
ncbi:MAG: hypothetical protein ABUS51_07425 [Acidobacteriota bacterium]